MFGCFVNSGSGVFETNSLHNTESGSDDISAGGDNRVLLGESKEQLSHPVGLMLWDRQEFVQE